MDQREGTIGRDEQGRAVERRTTVEEKIRHDVREMLEVFRADVPAFFQREARKRFVAHTDWAERLDDAKLAQLKRDVAAAAERAASEVVRALEPWELWAWDPRTPFPDSPRTLDPNPRVAAVLARIGASLAEVLERHGVPESESAKDAYKLPSYFVAGRFMKSLVESYWRNLQELVDLSKLIDESSHRDRRERSATRWDKA